MSLMDEAASIIAEANAQGFGETFELGGGTYLGTWNTPDMQTQMLTGGFQGRTEMAIVAHRAQFLTAPAQRDGKIVRLRDNTAWQIKEVNVDSPTHYVIHVTRQVS